MLKWPFPDTGTRIGYSPEQRETLAKVFQLVKPVLARHFDPEGKAYICNCIFYLNSQGQITGEETELAVDEIGYRLNGRSTFECWCRNQTETECAEINGNRDAFQQHRHAWLDQLIEEFSA